MTCCVLTEIVCCALIIRMLVYEYVNNGNLESWLHGELSQYSSLTWLARMKILLGTAKAWVTPSLSLIYCFLWIQMSILDQLFAVNIVFVILRGANCELIGSISIPLNALELKMLPSDWFTQAHPVLIAALLKTVVHVTILTALWLKAY